MVPSPEKQREVSTLSVDGVDNSLAMVAKSLNFKKENIGASGSYKAQSKKKDGNRKYVN